MVTGRRIPLLALLLVAWTVGLAADQVAAQRRADSEVTIVTGEARHVFRVEIASTPAERERGLMFRRELAADAGMLFDFQRPQPVSFWMKNTLIPLDMLFVAADGRIVNIAERAVPGSLRPISSAEPVRAVLEVNGGTAHRLGIAPGDRLEHPIFASPS